MKIPKHFYYITHRDNLKSVLEKGILSRNKTKDSLLAKIGLSQKIKSIHSEDVIEIRKEKQFKNRSLWDYANVYFQARTPMLYLVKHKFGEGNIIVLQINSDIIDNSDVGITDGNAASQNTVFFEDINEALKALNPEQFKKEYWTGDDDAKRKIMAELLVYDFIPPEKIIGIYTANEEIANEIRKGFIGPLNIMPNPNMFFLPEFQKSLSSHITLAKGDMFFSKMQTFTISVNTVGVMGKGLASRAKYQFPDVYVHYQDLCRQKKLKMGIPFLYKREGNFIKTLMEDTRTVETENGSRWFLLFPTKNHWRTSSPIDGIEEGMHWLSDNYKSLGIESIALPALGCGLGGLDWKDVGPLMCQYLNKMDIPACIYLPIEKQVPQEQLEPQFLLKTVQNKNNGDL